MKLVFMIAQVGKAWQAWIAICLTLLLSGCPYFDGLTHEARVELSASEAAEKIRAGELSSLRLTKSLITQIERYSNLNALITLNRGQALKQAKAADLAVASNKPLGKLHGVPLIVKDNIHVAGLPNSAGTPALADFVPADHAPVVQALVDEGAIILAKANMHELAFGITSDNKTFGRVGNPYRPDFTPGGSSGGTGAAIAARMVSAGLGTDTGGSVRIPASLNGIVSLRPSVSRYSQLGITPISQTRDTAGPMARSVRDLILLDAIISGDHGPVDAIPLSGLRIGIPREYFYANLDPETRAVIEAALQRLADAGVTLVEVDLPGVAELNALIGFPTAIFEAVTGLTDYLATYVPELSFEQLAAETTSPDVNGLFATLTVVDENNDGIPDGRIPESVYQDAILVHRPALQDLFAQYFSANALDALLVPTTPLTARPSEGLLDGVELNGNIENTFVTYIRNTDPDSNAGLPSVSIAVGLSANGLPVGMMLGGETYSDKRLLGIALSLEQLFGRLGAPEFN